MGDAPMIDLRPYGLGLVVVLATAAPAFASAELAREKNCVACHHPQRKMNGPSYKQIVEVYGQDEAAAKALAEKIRAGGGGVWGPMAMPAQPHVTPEEAEALVKWILTPQ
jgi:cytochrome c